MLLKDDLTYKTTIANKCSKVNITMCNGFSSITLGFDFYQLLSKVFLVNIPTLRFFIFTEFINICNTILGKLKFLN